MVYEPSFHSYECVRVLEKKKQKKKEHHNQIHHDHIINLAAYTPVRIPPPM